MAGREPVLAPSRSPVRRTVPCSCDCRKGERMPEPLIHPNRKEIARYVLARGTQVVPAPEAEELMPTLAPIQWPDDPAPEPQPPADAPEPDDSFPSCDVPVNT